MSPISSPIYSVSKCAKIGGGTGGGTHEATGEEGRGQESAPHYFHAIFSNVRAEYNWTGFWGCQQVASKPMQCGEEAGVSSARSGG